MAESKEKASLKDDPKETKTKKTPPEPTYTKREVLDASARFGVSPDVMAGALRNAGKENYTRADIEKAIQDFKKRKV